MLPPTQTNTVAIRKKTCHACSSRTKYTTAGPLQAPAGPLVCQAPRENNCPRSVSLISFVPLLSLHKSLGCLKVPAERRCRSGIIYTLSDQIYRQNMKRKGTKRRKKKDQPFQAAYLENPSKQDDDEPQEEAECHHGWENLHAPVSANTTYPFLFLIWQCGSSIWLVCRLNSQPVSSIWTARNTIWGHADSIGNTFGSRCPCRNSL